MSYYLFQGFWFIHICFL